MYNFLTYSELDLEVVENRFDLYKIISNYFYARVLEMFDYENLPETIPKDVFELLLLNKGICFFTKVNDDYYVFDGGLGGEPDVYYRPTLFTVANPALNLSENYEIDVDGILCKNDKLGYGLSELIKRTSTMLADNFLTMHMSDVNLRALMLLTAPDDKTKQSLEIFLNSLKDGKLSVVSESQIFDGIKRFDANHSSTGYITQFIELHQYILGSFYNEIGLNANFNMKRESIGKGEASLTQDTIFPLCDSMLSARQEFISKINKMYNLDIKVDFSSIWKQNRIEAKLELEQLKTEASSQLEKEGDENGDTVETREENSEEVEERTNEPELQSDTETDNGEQHEDNEGHNEVNIQVNITDSDDISVDTDNNTSDNSVDIMDNADNSSSQLDEKGDISDTEETDEEED